MPRRRGRGLGAFRSRFLRFSCVAAAAALLATPALAIPSPDVIVNFAASAGQILGLLAVLAGGVTFSKRRQILAKGEGARSSPWPFRVMLLLWIATAVAFLFYYLAAVDARNQRLQINLVRQSREDGKVVGDVTLKTLSYSEQLKHPKAITTETLAEWINAGRPLNLVDVREPEEVEMGRVRGTWHRRYPDIQRNKDGLAKDGRQTVLLCWSGNRSSELVDEFTEQGYDVRFMIGGYEKLLAEGNDDLLVDAKNREDLRDIPDYENKKVLLDTPEATALVVEENALVLDVRYEKEFAEEHIPGAVNLPMRKIPSEELERRIRELPKRPIMVACYDKRGSFYGLILGLRLVRAGHDYRGRYTVPSEFWLPKAEKSYVAAWKKEQEGKTLLSALGERLDVLLGALRGATGSLWAALLLIVLAARLLVLPFTLKAERDQARQHAVADEIKHAKEVHVDDSAARAHAIVAIQRREGMTPVRNLLGSCVQLTLFLLLFASVGRVAVGSTESFLWIPKLGEIDPTPLSALLVGLLFGVHLVASARARTKLRLGVALAVAAFLFWLTRGLAGASNVYLAANVGLLGVQGLLSRAAERARAARAAKALRPPSGPVFPLARAALVPAAGNKAARLGRMAAAGLPVPSGLVLTEAAFDGEVLKPEAAAATNGLWRRTFGDAEVAVRSSGANEDGGDRSYAGVFESVLEVRREGFADAVRRVRASLKSGRAAAYSGGREETGSIVVQTMVPAAYAGVLFTEHPQTSGLMLVECVAGLGEALVSGRATPKTFAFGRVTGAPSSAETPPIDFAPLLALGRRVEALFGAPQDVEWAYAGGRFHLLQARDITATAGARSPLENERRRLLARVAGAAPKGVVFAQNELSELLPRPTPFSLGFMNALWARGGSVDLACRRLGVRYVVEDGAPPYVVSAFGGLYVDRREEATRFGRPLGAAAAFRMTRFADAAEREYRETLAPAHRAEVRAREAIDLGRLTTAELVRTFDAWRRRFATETYVAAECVNVLADFCMKAARRRLERAGRDAAKDLAHAPRTVVQEAMGLLADLREGARPAADFLALFGHRAGHDFEFAEPRYAEAPARVAEMAARAVARPAEAPPPPLARRIDALVVDRARRFQTLKEEAKHDALRDVALIRRVVVELGSRLELGDGIFLLEPDEVARLADESFRDRVPGLIDARRAERDGALRRDAPTEFDARALETFASPAVGVPAPAAADDALRGLKVAGSGDVVGTVRVLRAPEEIGTFLRGEILVARFTDPAWTPIFPLARAVVTEVGGWLSHAAIQARECDVTGVVGVRGATERLRSGEVVRITADGVLERLSDRRRAPRAPTTARVVVERGSSALEASLTDVGDGGVHVAAPSGTFRVGDAATIRLNGAAHAARVEIVRETSSGFGARFTAPAPEFAEAARRL